MDEININSNVKIYFTISWSIGLMLLLANKMGWTEGLELLIFTTVMNFFISVIVQIFLVAMLLTFSENRIQFLHSLILLLFNFPFVLTFWCILILTY